MRSARRGVESRKSRLRVAAWAGGWFAPMRRARGRGKQGPAGSHRLLIEPLEQRQLLSATLTSLASFGICGIWPYGGVVEDSSGNLFGTTEYGGSSGDGTVFEIKAGSDAVTTLASFDGSKGANPYAGLIEDSSGNLFGTTEAGGAYGGGTVFEIKAGSDAVTTLASFNSTNGLYPLAGVIEDSSGNLLGTTYEGGADNYGTVFEIKAGSDAVTTLASFNYTNGANPYGVVEDGSGNLFGATEFGGADDDGTVFEIKARSGAVTTLVSFNGTNGDDPEAGVVEDSSGNLFGTTAEGGPDNYGTVFEIKAGSGAVTTLASFNSANGLYPSAGVVEDSNGNLFGTTLEGGADDDGTVFEIKARSGTVTTLASFNSTNGFNLLAGVVEDSSGNLFGTTEYGGSSGDGTVFEIAAGSDAVTTLASFDGSKGANPYGGVVEDSSGDLLGTTEYGGSSGDGTVFEIKAGGGAVTTLASFNGANGQSPYAGLIEDSSGNLFGTTEAGGAYGGGTVFEIAAGSDAVTTLASFNGASGDGPNGGVVEDSSGNLFGTTYYAGAYYDGTVFEIAAGSDAVTTLASFNGSNGERPYDGVVEDSNGNLFGTTGFGGAYGDGTVFEVKAGSDAITTLVSFNGTNGEVPDAGVVADSSGNLFGTTGAGGADYRGTVFEIKSGSGAVTTLASFDGDNGDYPYAGVVEDSDGNLFGTTLQGGDDDDGTVFEIKSGSGAVTTLASFNGANGQSPYAGLAEDSNGNLFGTTYDGGPGGYGTVFEVSPATTTTVSASQASVFYGTPVTFTATVSAQAGGTATAAGSVDFYDTTTGHDLGVGALASSTGTTSTWTLTTGVKTFNVTTGDTITATYTPGTGFSGSSGTTTQAVTALPITVTGITAADKTYNGNTTAALQGLAAASLVGVFSGDTVTLSTSGATGTFASKNVGTGITVSVTGLTLGGVQASDYTLTQPTTTANIAALPITVTAAANTKIYDGSTTAAAIPTVTGGSLATGDTAAFTETYDTNLVGTGKTLTPAGSVNDGNGGANYAVTEIANTTGAITARPNEPYINLDNGIAASFIGGQGTWVQIPIRIDNLQDSSGDVGLSSAYVQLNFGTTVNVAAQNLSQPAESGFTESGHTVTVITQSASGFVAGESVNIYAWNSSQYDGIFSIATVGDAFTLTSSGSGTFSLTYGGVTATGIAYNASPASGASSVQSILNAAFIAANSTTTATVTGSAGNYSIYFSSTGTLTAAAVTGSPHPVATQVGEGAFTYTLSAYANLAPSGGGNASASFFDQGAPQTAASEQSSITGGTPDFAPVLVWGTLMPTSGASAWGTGSGGDGAGSSACTIMFSAADANQAQDITTTDPTNGGTSPDGDILAYVFLHVVSGTASAAYDTSIPVNVVSGGTTLIGDGASGGNPYSLTSSSFQDANVDVVPNSTAPVAELSVNTSKLPSVAGDTTYTVPLMLAPSTPGGPGISSATADILFDPTYINATSFKVSAGSLIPSTWKNISNALDTNDIYSLDGYSPSNDTNCLVLSAEIPSSNSFATIASNSAGSLWVLTFTTMPGMSGSTVLNLVPDAEPAVETPTMLSDNVGSYPNGYTLSPVPTWNEAPTGWVPPTGWAAGDNPSVINPVDGVINFVSGATTTTTVTSSKASVVYGTAVTFTATVSATSGATTGGSVDFYDTTTGTDLGLGTFGGSRGTASTWTLATGVNTSNPINVMAGDTITATYTAGSGFADSSGTTTQTVTAIPITVTATANTKTYDATPTAAATPTITSGSLVGGQIAAFTENYNTQNAGTGETLTPSGTVEDGNGGHNYAVTFVANTTGQITPRAITVTAATSTKTYDGTTSSTATPTITSGSLASSDAGVVTTLAGSAGQVGSSDGTGSAASFGCLDQVAVDSAGNVYVADWGNEEIRKITPSGVVTTLAGAAGQTGSSDGTGSAARFWFPTGVAVDSAGDVFVADSGNDEIRMITPSGVVTTLAGSVEQYGYCDGTGGEARFAWPTGVAVDSAGNVYVADSGNDVVREITPSGVVTTLAGSAGQQGSDDGTGSAARFDGPSGVAVDSVGNVYVADSGNCEIRVITPSGVVSTLAGSAGQAGSSDGSGSAARFDGPCGVTVDSAGNVYVTDSDEIRKITPSGVVTTLAGSPGQTGSSDGTGSAAGFAGPVGVAVDSAGNVYVADSGNQEIRVVSPVAGDTPAFSETFGTKNAGTGKTLMAGGSVSDGNGGHNYAVTFVNNTTGVISQAVLTVTAAANSKTYDGTTSAAATPTVTSGSVASGDTASFTESYDTKNAGTGKTLTVGGSVNDGNGGNNYAVTFVNNTTGVISQAALTITAAANNKTYDGTTSAAATPTVTSGSVASGDTASFTESYNTKNAGTGLTLTPTGSVNDGNGGDNYLVTFVAGTVGTISARAVTATGITAADKTYNGNAAAALEGLATASLVGLVSGDTVTLGTSGAAGTFTSKNVGQNITVSVTGLTISGPQVSDYTLTQPAMTANITAATLTVTGITAANKTYNGNVTATLQGLTTTSLLGVLSGDTVTLQTSGAVGTFASKDVAQKITVSVTGLTISGAQASNYALTQPSTTANITPMPLTVTATGIDKVWDGTSTARVTLSDNHLPGDGVIDNYASACFSGSSVGNNKPVSVTGITITGPDAGDYALQNATATTTASILNETVTVIDDGAGAAGGWTTTGTWSNWTNQGYDGDVHQATPITAANPVATATWTFSDLTADLYYQVETTWTKNTNRASNAPYTISGGPSTSTLTVAVNQRLAPAGVSADNWTWQELGVYESTATGELVVTLSNCGANGNVIADAVRVEPAPSNGPSIMVQEGTVAANDPVVLPTLSGGVQTTVSFGTVVAGAVARETFIVFNGGSGELSYVLSPLPAGYTLYSGSGSANVDPGSSAQFVLQESTSAVGTNSGTVTLTTNDGAENDSFSFPVTGTVLNVAPTAAISASPNPVSEGSPVTVSLINPVDPVLADQTAGYHYNFAATEAGLATIEAGLATSGKATTYATASSNNSYTFTAAGGSTETFYARIINANGLYSDIPVTVTVKLTATIIDDSAGAAGGFTTTGTWQPWAGLSLAYGGTDHEAMTAGATAAWTFSGLAAGTTYDVYVTWPANSNRTAKAPYTVTANGATTPFTVNQQAKPSLLISGSGPSGGNWSWYELSSGAVGGSYTVGANGQLVVQVSNKGLPARSSAANNVEADAVMIVQQEPELAAGGVGHNPNATSVTASEAMPLVQKAELRWAEAGANLSALGNVQVVVGNLPGTELAASSAMVHTIYLDTNAQGYGWFIDPTPGQDSEFPVQVAKTEERAASGAAASEMDLLTVIMHEMGHFLGYQDLDPQVSPYDLMSASLAAGVRRLPDSVAAQGSSAQATDAALAALAQPQSGATANNAAGYESEAWWLLQGE